MSMVMVLYVVKARSSITLMSRSSFYIVLYEDVIVSEEPKRCRGRPKKTALAAVKKGNRGVRGRPKGDAAVMNEYKARMLASPKSAKVLESIFNAALDDDHKNQAAAWKLVMDRVAPTAMFEKEVVQGTSRSAIQINITGVNSANIGGGDVIDGDSGEILQD